MLIKFCHNDLVFVYDEDNSELPLAVFETVEDADDFMDNYVGEQINV